MRPRQKIIEMFSTFVELEGDRFSKWLIDIKLHRNIQNCLESSPFVPNSENFWALHWHKCWREESNSLARMHLSAYLQEPKVQARIQDIYVQLKLFDGEVGECFSIQVAFDSCQVTETFVI